MKLYFAIIVLLTSVACKDHNSKNEEGQPIEQIIEQLKINYQKYEFKDDDPMIFKDLFLNDDDLKDVVLSVRFKERYTKPDPDPTRIYFFLLNKGNGLYKVGNVINKILNDEGLDGGGYSTSHPMNTYQKDELVIIETGTELDVNWQFSFYFKYDKSLTNWMLQKVVQEKCNRKETLHNPRGLMVLNDCKVVGEIKEDGKKSIEKVKFNDYYRDGRGLGEKGIFSN